ncbi:flagellar filament capping protein FliD [Clostridium sp. JS66]|uniref:flagellar filament capping protein FliD n=1 Tax=Clostridium sp. JS66 TaxID=3064705 RepID=UPI00298E575D|nr:flagellar filament capping protein FliD [Clostridium sp. JS66]WPC44085.1 flagellar filament capping protein FliD [Clostridium sp. JS66]
MSSISSLQQYQMSSMQNECSTLLGTSSSDPIIQSIEQAISPTNLYEKGQQALQTNTVNSQASSEQANILAQFSACANDLYQCSSQLQTNTDYGSVVSNTVSSVNNDNIKSFVNAYNSMVSFVSENQQYLNTSILNNLSNDFNNASSDLQSIGITKNSDGTLNIDQDTLNDALQNNVSTVQSAFSSFDGIAVTAGGDAQAITESSLSTYANQISSTSSNSSEVYNNLVELQQDYQWSSLINSFA